MFFSDSAAIVDVINNQTLKHRGITVLLMDLVLSCLNLRSGVPLFFSRCEKQKGTPDRRLKLP